MLKLIRTRLKSKTYRAAMVGALLAMVESNSGILSALLPVAARPYAVMAWPILMITLRPYQ